AFSPDGQFVACGSRSRTGMLTVWNFRRRAQVLSTPHGHSGAVTAIAYSADCSVIYTGSDDHTVRMRRTSPGSLSVVLPGVGHRATVTCLASSPDGQHVASGSTDGIIIIWNAKSGAATSTLRCHSIGRTPIECFRDAEGPAVTALAYSANGQRLISGSPDGVVRVWDATEMWRRYDAASDLWGYKTTAVGMAAQVTRALVDRLRNDLQLGSRIEID
ncbi:WD40 repeat-like protein, partial [Exidia glandulosa HHB12029]